MNELITIVITVSSTGRIGLPGFVSDIQRFEWILLPSLEKFFSPQLLHRVLVVCPDKDFTEVRGCVKHLKLPYTVLRDSQVLNTNLVADIGGWYRQQLIKLNINEFVQTRHYLILDADMFATRTITSNDLFVDGMPRVSLCPFFIHEYWWRQTANTFSIPLRYSKNDLLPDFTPQIIDKELVKGMISWLERVYSNGKPWLQFLVDKVPMPQYENIMWTEYCLYWLYILSESKLEDSYFVDPKFVFTKHSIWTAEDYKNADASHYAKVFDENSVHCFSVIQSIVTEAKPTQIYSKIRKYIAAN